MLRQGNIGAAKLTMEKNGLALPKYSDSAKVAYVLQGNGVAGIILPEKEEKVLAIKKGDAIALPFWCHHLVVQQRRHRTNHPLPRRHL
ncbi:UNVERIFIED_CONTAM: hypothetical protein Sangu_0294600 [Sesamum angustifolium]|uniref:Cupin type-1 domain-containing protein n=1 Tax=Sesamum angustifolium TaxID=2727405 RepID=A0AAW2QPW5_9LAMI